jgi:raffinose/stachyose/melibiose transport system substrate-binding protein
MSTLRLGRLSAAFAMVALVATACTGVQENRSTPAGSGAGASGGGDVTGDLRYLVEAPEDPAQLDPLRAQLEIFEEANPGITVELEAVPLDTLRTTLQPQLRSGEGPDVFSWGSGPAFGGAFAEAGLLYDLTDAYEQYGWPVYGFAKDQVTFDGKVMGVPGEMETVGLFYNVDMFEELGIEEPTTLPELEAAADTIMGTGTIPIAVHDAEGWQGGHLLSMALSSRVGGEGMEALLNGEASWDSPDVVAALETWQRFNEAGYLPPTPTAVDYDTGNSLFFSGEAAMLPNGSWLVNDIPEVDFEVGYIPFPAEDGPGIFTAGLGSGPYISANTEHPEAALELVDFLVSPEFGQFMVEELTVIPPFPVEAEGLEVSPLFAQVLEDTASFAGGEGEFGANIDVRSTELFNEAMWNGVQGILTGQQTPEEAAQAMEAAAAE